MTETGEKISEKKTAGRTGIVSAKSSDKTIRVVVESLVKHQTYGKYMRRRTKLAVHDPKNSAGVGDRVEIVPCRRMSKDKSWRLVRVVRKSTAPTEAVAEIRGY